MVLTLTVCIHDVFLLSALFLPMLHSFTPPTDTLIGWGSRQTDTSQKALVALKRISHESLTSTRKTVMPYQQELMKEAEVVVKRKSGIKVTRRVISSTKPSNVYSVASSQEYKDMINKLSKDNIIVTRFYAKWCKACIATTPLFNRLATNNPNIVFIQVAIQSDSSDLYEELKIPSIPFSHIYHHSAGLVEEIQLSKKRWPIYEKIIATYVQAYCPIENGNYSNHLTCETVRKLVDI